VAGRVSVPVGEPLLLQVTIYNISSIPLTVGPDGVIHQDLWLDAQTRGVQPHFFPAEAFARLGGPMVLRPQSSMSQVVRLDQAQLLAMLERFPTAHFQIMASVMTNPTTVAGQVRPGPAGNQVTLSKLMERRGAPVGQLDVRQKLAEAIQSGTPDEKVRAAETLTKFATLFSGPNAGDEAKAFGAQAVEAVRHTTNDPDPAVSAWASYLYTVYTGDEQQLKNLLNDPTWVARLLGIVATDFAGKSRDLFQPLATTDAEPLVRNFAAAALEAKIMMKPPGAGGDAASTQPGTQPAAPMPAASTTQPDALSTVSPAATPSRIEPVAPALTPAVPTAVPPGVPSAGTQPAR